MAQWLQVPLAQDKTASLSTLELEDKCDTLMLRWDSTVTAKDDERREKSFLDYVYHHLDKFDKRGILFADMFDACAIEEVCLGKNVNIMALNNEIVRLTNGELHLPLTMPVAKREEIGSINYIKLT